METQCTPSSPLEGEEVRWPSEGLCVKRKWFDAVQSSSGSSGVYGVGVIMCVVVGGGSRGEVCFFVLCCSAVGHSFSFTCLFLEQVLVEG